MKRFLTTLGLMVFLPAVPATAAQLQNGKVQFDRPPQLVATTATRNAAGDGVYAFTLTLPADAGESLAAVMISPSQSIDDSSFDLNQTEAFLGTADQPHEKLELQTVEPIATTIYSSTASSNSDQSSIQIVFAQPIAPNATVTIELKPSQTPSRHVYEFGVTAVPVADRPEPTFVGYGNFDFRGDRYRQYPFWWSRDRAFPFYGDDHRVLFWDLPPEFDIRLRHRR